MFEIQTGTLNMFKKTILTQLNLDPLAIGYKIQYGHWSNVSTDASLARQMCINNRGFLRLQ